MHINVTNIIRTILFVIYGRRGNSLPIFLIGRQKGRQGKKLKGSRFLSETL